MENQIQKVVEKLNPDYIAGYVDGEGCFGLQFRKDIRHERPGKPVYYSWKAQFMIAARKDELCLFKRIKYTFGCGEIYNQKKDDEANMEIHYCVSNLDDLKNIISPFFKEHQLQAKKRYDFELWAEAIDIMYRNKKKTLNITRGQKGFSKNKWDKNDLSRLITLHSKMQKYKATRPNGLKHIDMATKLLIEIVPDKK